MTMKNTHAWLFVPILLVGLCLMGACGENPTTPGDGTLGLSEGGSIDQADLMALTEGYQNLVDAGGGAKVVADTDGNGILGMIDRWTGIGLKGVAIFVDNAGTLGTIGVDGTKLFDGLEWPINVTVFTDGYITQSIVSTNANCFLFPMEPLIDEAGTVSVYAACQPSTGGATIGEFDPWLLTGTTTNNWHHWNDARGKDYEMPFLVTQGNPYRDLGLVCFLAPSDIESSGALLDPPAPGPNGYFYKDLQWVPPGAITGWIFIIPEISDDPLTHVAGNYTIDAGVLTEEQFALIQLVPGGNKTDGWQFIPYGLRSNLHVEAADGPTDTYNFDAYDPDTGADRETIEASIIYASGATESRYTAWDPADGSVLPDITFGVPPVVDEATLNMLDGTLTAEWTNTPAAGLVKLTVYGRGRFRIWELYFDSDATGTPVDGLGIFSAITASIFSGASTGVTRIECAGISNENFDFDTIWLNATSFCNSAPIVADDGSQATM